MSLNQFTTHSASDPITVLLNKSKGQSWDEEIADKNKDEMDARLRSIAPFKDPSTGVVSDKPRAEIYQSKWERRTRGRKDKPRYTEHGHEPGHPDKPVHKPIIVKETEFVRFQGPAPFFVMIIPEPELKQVVVTNPFMGFDSSSVEFCEHSKLDNATGQHFVQKQVRDGDDVVGQLFWKMIFVVIDDGTPYLVDPDFFCDR